MPSGKNTTEGSSPAKSVLEKFVDLAGRAFAPGRRLSLASDATGPQSMQWAPESIYPDALADAMAPLSSLDVQALEFFPN